MIAIYASIILNVFCLVDAEVLSLIILLNSVFAILVFVVFGYALVELCLQLLKKHPWKGIRYGSTSVSDAIAHAMMGEVPKRTLRTRPATEGRHSFSVNNSKLRQFRGPGANDVLTRPDDIDDDRDTGIQYDDEL